MNRNNNPQSTMNPWLVEALKQIRNEREATYSHEDDVSLRPTAQPLLPNVLRPIPYLHLSLEESASMHLLEQIAEAEAEKEASETEETSPTSSAEKQVPLPQQFIKALEIVLKKAEELETRHHFETYNNPARHLHNAIKWCTDEYKNGNKTLEVFKQDCQKEIERYRPQLETHRGWKQILGNLLVAVLTLGIFYPVALAIHKKLTGNTLFFSGKGHTDSSKKVEQLAEAIEALKEEKSNETPNSSNQQSSIGTP